MKFAGAIWKLLVGIKDALVLLLLLLFFALVYAALSARPAPVGHGVLDFRLRGSIVEQPSRRNWTELAGGGSLTREYRLSSLVRSLQAAKDDSRVKAVALDVTALAGGGQTAIAELAEAIRAVRASGKPVLAYGIGYSDDSYQLAAAASEIWLNPLGAVVVTGPGGSNLYFKGLLDKLGVTANVYRVGAYKAAVEPYTRSDMSAEARQNATALSQALLESWRDDVRKSRPKANVDLFLRDMPGAVERAGGDMARAALAAGLVDKIGDQSAFERRLAELGGEAAHRPGGYKQIKLASYVNDVAEDEGNGPIGLVTVAGLIVDGEAGPGTAGGDTIAEAVDRGVDAGIKALVVRVDSPGGSVLASERIRQSLLRAKAQKIPIVVSMGNVAASGGYWVATAGDFIFAEPSTTTGSIGVFGVLPSFQGTLEKLGLGADGVKTTPLAGEPDLFKGPSEDVNRLIQTGVEAIYGRFLNLVATARRKTPQEVHQIAQGRVWDGGTARQLGLVDGFGGTDEAIAKAAQLASLGNERRITYLEPPRSFEDELIELVAAERDKESAAPDAFASIAARPREQLAQAIANVTSIWSGPTIQARCIECAPSAPVRVKPAELGWLAVLARLVR